MRKMNLLHAKALMKKKTLKIALMACLCSGIGITTAHAVPDGIIDKSAITQQSIRISGTVKDNTGEPVIGANIVEKGTTNGTSTDIDGKFTLSVRNAQSVIVVSYIGYNSQEAIVGNRTNIDIVLAENSMVMDEVVVIGYGTQRKGDVSSAIVSVKADDFAVGRIGDAAELVKGKIAGMTIVNITGDPNAVSNIRLRGISSLRGNSDPLVLIDGVEGELNHVAPENIESIDVLKDASAASIYGTRGANGVILITTRSGRRASRAEVTLTTYFSTGNWTKKMDFMTAQDVRDAAGDYTKTTFSDMGADTDWLEEISRDHSSTQNYSVNIRGGAEKSAYSGTFTYKDDKGMLNRTYRKTMTTQLDFSQFAMNDMLKFHINLLVLSYDRSNDGSGNRDGDGYQNSQQAYRQAVIRNPTQPIYNDDGSYNEELTRFQYYNPVAINREWDGNIRNNQLRVTGDVTIEPIKNWQTMLQLTRRQTMQVNQLYLKSQHFSMHTSGTNGRASKSNSNSIQDQLELTSRYSLNIGKHRAEGLVGYSYIYNMSDGFSANNSNFPTDFFSYNNMSIGSFRTDPTKTISVSSDKSDNKLIAFFGRLQYNYDNRFSAIASIRREGSSRFGDNHKWGNFPAISGAWNIQNEEFMRGISWLDELKLRVGYGVSGNNAGANYATLTRYSYQSATYLSKDGTWSNPLQASNNPNPNLRWEKTKELNIGIDWRGFNDRLGLNIDLYNKNTEDLLYNYSVPVPPNINSSMLANVGKMQNRGVEVTITATPVTTKDFEWKTTLVASHNKNKLVSLTNDVYTLSSTFSEFSAGIGDPLSGAVTHYWDVGHSLGGYSMHKQVGWNEEGFPLYELKNAETGEWYVAPWQRNMPAASRQQTFGLGSPKLIMGWNNTLNYKGFDLNMQFTGQFFYKILNTQRVFYENNSIAYNRLRSSQDLHPVVELDENQNLVPVIDPATGQQKMVRMHPSVTQHVSSMYLENGNFFKLSNFTVGYTLPIKTNKYVKAARVYFSGQNVFTLTSYSGIDPEVNIGDGAEDSRGGGGSPGTRPGADNRDKYPTVRTFTVGLNVNF
ncbi:TonB-linked SusC/RagA family outer membrane protein [Parabacteroides sp. PFB2-10]|uniref:SusC/RagA family TonB-linked outer membrane protein n=1 Tax=Parabacteroides sp. PFB2-10 TaxID=1742405 RepID=UPI0024745B8F|nr:SusC/RagA family TonB-linked outer membrane protein [Parabacteroides sp. PFB2-10]MDH6311670.1 TonB-linked SusC/RagA family outer membrane protein [Parabacteroides sp. PFB2-10]